MQKTPSFYGLIVWSCLLGGCSQAQQAQRAETDTLYRYREAMPDGIGKWYQGREIAHVMGHQGAGWLERSEREEEERTDLLMDALDLAPDAVVADIGAGTGYFTFRLARRVPQGRVLAVDIQPEMIAYLNEKKEEQRAANVTPILGTITQPRLPTDRVDLVLLVDAYHEFSHPYEMMAALAQSLAPNGKIALVEYRAEDPSVPIKPLHKMSEAQAQKEMAQVGLQLLENKDLLPQQHLMLFGLP
ncbi:methyltransferase, FkbM family [Catalinimonas alkaloidigena]|uniref:Methyltransferase, FkbM family n=1 Tax=Catalinimonas alkaloidigena TaxID=1075417 RepID=A0A1G9BQ10_9BACT|nr:class I SAM-dependent methyltransferase [Catalinimonas alkaloidigena]SDK41234.1 methyltransferase, FkbM family [Catalinimonas alkaloidigena]